jgi:pimeloyl-ACP methyl ester carboxylesterase
VTGIHHVVEGPAGAPAVLLAHPLGVTHRLWDEAAAALRDRYRVVRYDVRGHGGSAVPPGPYTLAQMAGDARALLDGLDIEAVHFVGMSMGGCIAMAFALDHPDRVRSLVLCDTTACYGPAVQPMWDDRIRVAETSGMTPELVERTMAIWFSAEYRAAHGDVVDRVAAMLAATDPAGMRPPSAPSAGPTSATGSAPSASPRWSWSARRTPARPSRWRARSPIASPARACSCFPAPCTARRWRRPPRSIALFATSSTP